MVDMRPELRGFLDLIRFDDGLSIVIYIYTYIPVVPDKAVAEVSKIGHL